MIATSNAAVVFGRLAQRAAALAEAAAAQRALDRSASPDRWRNAALLWPRFTKG